MYSVLFTFSGLVAAASAAAVSTVTASPCATSATVAAGVSSSAAAVGAGVSSASSAAPQSSGTSSGSGTSSPPSTSAGDPGNPFRICVNQTVPVTITSRNAVFGKLQQPANNLDVTAFILANIQQGANATAEFLTGYNTISNTYNISTQYCRPANATGSSPAIQVLTHGIGFDKTYWDLSYANYNYSYINSAIKQGYSTLSYDRLGIGNSSHGDPINEIQSFLEIQALRALTEQLRGGTFPNVSQKFTKVVHVGHSFGSAQTFSFINSYPDLSDGAILTGFSMNSSFVADFAAGGNFQIASGNQPLRFGALNYQTLEQYIEYSPLADLLDPVDLTTFPAGEALPNGYVITSDFEGNYLQFFKPYYFNPAVLFVVERTKQPVTYGELLTLASLPMMNAFTKPVLVITGDSDVPYCGGSCYNTGGSAPNVVSSVAKTFTNNSKVEIYIQPNSGHGINFHYNSTGAYNVINSFIAANGITSS